MKKSKPEDYESPEFNAGKPYALYRQLDKIAAELKAGTFRIDKEEEIRQLKFKERQQKLWDKTKLYRDVEFENPPEPNPIAGMYGAFMPNFNSCTNKAFAKPPCNFDMPFLYETDEQETIRKAREEFGLPEEDQDNLEPSQIPYESIYIKRWIREHFGKFRRSEMPTSSKEKIELENLPQTGEWFRPLELYGPITAIEDHHGKPRLVKRVIGYREMLRKRTKMEELRSTIKRRRRVQKQTIKEECTKSVVIDIEEDRLATIEEEPEISECSEFADIACLSEIEGIPLSWGDETASLSDSWTDISSNFSLGGEDNIIANNENSWNKIDVTNLENEVLQTAEPPSKSESFEVIDEIKIQRDSTPASSSPETSLDSEEELNREMELFYQNVTPFRWPWQVCSPIPVGGMLPGQNKKRDKKQPDYPPAPWGEVFNAPQVKDQQKRRITKKRSRGGLELPEESSSGSKDRLTAKKSDRKKKNRHQHKQFKSSSSSSADNDKRRRRHRRRSRILAEVVVPKTQPQPKSAVTTTSSKKTTTKKPLYYKKEITTKKTYYYAPTGGESSGQDKKRNKPSRAVASKRKVKLGESSKAKPSKLAHKTSSHSIRVLVKKRSSIIKRIQSSNLFERDKKSKVKFSNNLQNVPSGNANIIAYPVAPGTSKGKPKPPSSPWYLQKIDSTLEEALIQKQIIQKPPKRIQTITLPPTSASSAMNSDVETRFLDPIPEATKSEMYLLENMDERPMLPPLKPPEFKTRLEEKQALDSQGRFYDKMDKHTIDLKVYRVETDGERGSFSKDKESDKRPTRLHASAPDIREGQGQSNRRESFRRRRSEAGLGQKKRKIAKREKDNEWLLLSDTDRELADALEAETLDKKYLAWMNPLISYESQNMRRAMALYNWMAKITWRQPITNMEAEDYKLVHYFVNRKRQLPFIVTSMLMFGAMVCLIQSFVDISVKTSKDIYGDIERIELNRYRIFAAFIFVNLIIISMWGIAIILHDGYAFAQYLNYMAASLTKIESSAVKGVTVTIKRNILIFGLYAGITTIAFICDTPGTIRGTCGFIAFLFCRPIVYQYRPKKEIDLIFLQLIGFFIHLYVMFCVRLMLTFLQVIAIFLRNAARFWNFKFGLCFAQFGTEERGQLYRLKWAQSQRKLFIEHRLINGLSRRYGYTFSVGLFAYFVLQLALLALVLVIMFFDDEARHTVDPEYEQYIRSNGYDVAIRNTVLEDALTNMFVGLYTLGDFLMVTHVIANAGKAVMDGYEFVRRQGLIRCDNSHERRLVMSLQWSFSARNPPLISIRNFFRIDRKGILGGISFMIMIVSLIIQLKQTTNITVIVKRPCNTTFEGYWAERALSRDMRWCHFKVSLPSGEAEQYYKEQDTKNRHRITTTPPPCSRIYFILEHCDNITISYTLDAEKANKTYECEETNTLACNGTTCTITPKNVDDYNCPMEAAYLKEHLPTEKIESTVLPICYTTIPTDHLVSLDKEEKRFLKESEWEEVRAQWDEDCELSSGSDNKHKQDHYNPKEFSGNCVHELPIGQESATFDWKGLLKYYYQPCWSPLLKKYILLQQVRICSARDCPWIPLRDARRKEFQQLEEYKIIPAARKDELEKKYMDCGFNPYPRIDILYWKMSDNPKATSQPLTHNEWVHKTSKSPAYTTGKVYVNCARLESSIFTEDRDDCNWQNLETLLIAEKRHSEYTSFIKPGKTELDYKFEKKDFIMVSEIMDVSKPATNPNLECVAAGMCTDKFKCYYDHIGRCNNTDVQTFCAPLLKPVKAYLYGDDCAYEKFDTPRDVIQKTLNLTTNNRGWKFVDAKPPPDTCVKDVAANNGWGCYCEGETACTECNGLVEFDAMNVGTVHPGKVYLLGESLSPIGLKKAKAPYMCSGFVNKYDLLRYEVVTEAEYQKARNRWALSDISLSDFYKNPEAFAWIEPKPNNTADPKNFKEVCEHLENFIPKTLADNPKANQLFFHHARIFREPCRDGTKDKDIISLIQVVGVQIKSAPQSPPQPIMFYDLFKTRSGSCKHEPYPFWKLEIFQKNSTGERGETYHVCRFDSGNSKWETVQLTIDDFDECGNLRQPEYEKVHDPKIKTQCDLSHVVAIPNQGNNYTMPVSGTDANPYSFIKADNTFGIQIETGPETNRFNVTRRCWKQHFAQVRCGEKTIHCTQDQQFEDDTYFFYKFTDACDKEKFYIKIDADKTQTYIKNAVITLPHILTQSEERNILNNNKADFYKNLIDKQADTFCSVLANPAEMDSKFCSDAADNPDKCQYRLTFEDFWGITGIWDENEFSPPLFKSCPIYTPAKSEDFVFYLARQFYPCDKAKPWQTTMQVHVNTISKEGRLYAKDLFRMDQNQLCGSDDYVLKKDEEEENIDKKLAYIPWMKLELSSGTLKETFFTSTPNTFKTDLLDKKRGALALEEVKKFK